MPRSFRVPCDSPDGEHNLQVKPEDITLIFLTYPTDKVVYQQRYSCPDHGRLMLQNCLTYEATILSQTNCLELEIRLPDATFPDDPAGASAICDDIVDMQAINQITTRYFE